MYNQAMDDFYEHYRSLYGHDVIVTYKDGTRFRARYLDFEVQDDYDDHPIADWYEIQPVNGSDSRLCYQVRAQDVFSIEAFDPKTMRCVPPRPGESEKLAELRKQGFMPVEGIPKGKS